MKKIILVIILLFGFSVNTDFVKAEDFECGQFEVEYFEGGLMSTSVSENDFADYTMQRDYRLDDDYYVLKDAIVEGVRNFEHKIDLTGFSIQSNMENVEKLYMIVKYDVGGEVAYTHNDAVIWHDTSAGEVKAIEVKYAYEENGLPIVELNRDLQERSDNTIEDALDLISDDMNDIDKALVLHDYLVDKVDYVANDIDQTAGSALADFETVCAGYARAYSTLLNKVGIENRYVTGLIDNTYSHAWNTIYIEDQWYQVDVTWDDVYSNTSGNLSRTYFMITDDQIKSKRHSSWDWFAPVCNDAKYNQSTFIFDNNKDLGFYNGNYYFIDNSSTKLRYGSIDTHYSDTSIADVDLTAYSGGDVYKNYVYLYSDSSSEIDRYNIYTEDLISVYTAQSGTIQGIEINDDEITLKIDGNIVKDEMELPYKGNINSELIDLQINPIDDGTGDYVISGKVVVVEWVDGISTVPEAVPVMSFKGEFGDKLDVFVTAEGTNTYYFDRRISSSGLVDGQNFRFEITSGDPDNISDFKSMYLYLSTSPNVENEKSFRIADTKSISYEMDYQGQLIIFNEDDPYDYVGNINSELISLDIVPVEDGTGDVVITGEVIVVEWINGSDPMGDPNENPMSTVPRQKPAMSFVASDLSGSLDVFVTALGTNTYYFDRRISGEGLAEGMTFNFNIKSGNERNLSEYNTINLYLSTSNGVEKYRQYALPSGKIIHYYENPEGELELSNLVIPVG